LTEQAQLLSELDNWKDEVEEDKKLPAKKSILNKKW
jgi:hypothetical protein